MMSIITLTDGYFSTGGRVTRCPLGSACWPEITDPIIEYRTNGDDDILVFVGHEIENASNDYKMPKGERR